MDEEFKEEPNEVSANFSGGTPPPLEVELGAKDGELSPGIKTVGPSDDDTEGDGSEESKKEYVGEKVDGDGETSGGGDDEVPPSQAVAQPPPPVKKSIEDENRELYKIRQRPENTLLKNSSIPAEHPSSRFMTKAELTF